MENFFNYGAQQMFIFEPLNIHDSDQSVESKLTQRKNDKPIAMERSFV
jgi:hypothetical protein